MANDMILTETFSPSGNCITIESGGRILGRVTELITAKIGGDDQTKGILSTIITVATTVGITAATAGAGTPVAATVAAKAGVGLAGGMAQLAANHLMHTPQYSETKETMSFNEFRHKYVLSGSRPISLELEYNRDLANQYLNKRELKGPMLYSYRNYQYFGNLLTRQPSNPSYLLKASIIT
ncbi:7372_t:CDS:1 [Ambispora leptoticha]|uniref:7372_t:CDS:1 n=1 Tax=Ambispora leptoticha TaxID=144679 RepID=A0A9N9CUR9_9GLOM|nr:7372_t:CDS:1 [Ambispora leptoticha]